MALRGDATADPGQGRDLPPRRVQLQRPHRGLQVIHSSSQAISLFKRYVLFSFRQIDPNTVKTIFILGPSHHVRLSGCAVSQCVSYKTPIGDLTINRDINKELLDTGD